jgi:hypothetical protein
LSNGAQKNSKIQYVVKQPKVATGEMKSMIDKAIDDEHRRLDISEDGVAFMEENLNPLGNECQGYKYVGAKLPDGTPNSIVLSVGSEFTFSGAAATSGYIMLRVPALDMFAAAIGTMCHVFHGNDPLNLANAPNAHINGAFVDEWELLIAILSTDGARLRIGSGAIKVVPVSANINTSGVVRPCWHRSHPVITGIAPVVYSTYDECFDSWAGPNYELVGPNPGLQFRTFLDPEKLHFEAPLAVMHASTGDKFGKMPGVYFNIGNLTQLKVQYVMHIEVEIPPSKIPFPIMAPKGEEELFQMIQFLNSSPCHIEGNSFPSFIKKISGAVKKGFRIYNKVKPIIDYAKPILGLM